MSRARFISALKEGLADLPQSQIDEIASDYEFHFAEATAAGQSEDDVVARLGDPARLARELRGNLGNRDFSGAKTTPMAWREYRKPALFLVILGVIGMAAAYYFAIHGRGEETTLIPIAPGAPRPAASAPASGIKVEISGGQVLDLGTITQDRLEIVVDGGGRATAKGRVKELIVRVDGSGTVDFGGVQADIVDVEISGTGNAGVFGTQMVDVTISGAGSVRLKAKPKTLKQSITGPGRIILPD